MKKFSEYGISTNEYSNLMTDLLTYGKVGIGNCAEITLMALTCHKNLEKPIYEAVFFITSVSNIEGEAYSLCGTIGNCAYYCLLYAVVNNLPWLPGLVPYDQVKLTLN